MAPTRTCSSPSPVLGIHSAHVARCGCTEPVRPVGQTVLGIHSADVVRCGCADAVRCGQLHQPLMSTITCALLETNTQICPLADSGI